MKKKQKLFPTSVSVPVKLKRHMDRVKGVNWSAVACQAFALKLAQISQNGGQKSAPDRLLTQLDFDQLMAVIEQLSQRLLLTEKGSLARK